MPRVSLRLAYRWLNIDTYWEMIAVADPNEANPGTPIPPKAALARPVEDYPPELIEKYPLQNRQQSGPRVSGLHDPLEPDLAVPTLVEQLVHHLRAELNYGNLSEARARVAQIETVCASLPITCVNTLFRAEALLACGLAYRTIGENSCALEYFEKSLKGFSGQDAHAEAVVRWMMGVIELETPKTLLNAGLLNWQAAWKIFAAAAGENHRSKAESQWYQSRASQMFADLQQATADSALPPDPALTSVSSAAGSVPTSTAAPATSATAPGAPPPGAAATTPPTPAAAGSGASTSALGPAQPAPPLPATPPSAQPAAPIAATAPPAQPAPPLPATPSPAQSALPLSTAPPPQPTEPPAGPTRIFVTVPDLGPIIIGGSDTPKAEGELFWSHDLKATLRLVGMVGGKKSAMVMERTDGVEFPAEASSPAQRQRLFPEEVFDRQLECQNWIWLPLPRPAGAALRFAEIIPPPSSMAAWLQLANVPVCESVAADPWGTSEARVREGRHGSLTFPWVYFDLGAGEGKQKRYCLRSFTNEGTIRLSNGEKYAFMRVTGDSMDAARQYPITAGDWVLVRRTDKPDDYRIVVANVTDPTTGDFKATLKRKLSDGLHSESHRDYPVVPKAQVASFVGEVIAVAKPDAGTLFKA